MQVDGEHERPAHEDEALAKQFGGCDTSLRDRVAHESHQGSPPAQVTKRRREDMGRGRLTVREAREQRRLQALFKQHVEPDPPPQPCSYGMTAEQLREYGAQLIAEGWRPWEVRARLTDPLELAA